MKIKLSSNCVVIVFFIGILSLQADTLSKFAGLSIEQKKTLFKIVENFHKEVNVGDRDVSDLPKELTDFGIAGAVITPEIVTFFNKKGIPILMGMFFIKDSPWKGLKEISTTDGKITVIYREKGYDLF